MGTGATGLDWGWALNQCSHLEDSNKNWSTFKRFIKNKIKNLLGPIYWSSDPWSLILDPWCQLVNEQLTSLEQWTANVSCLMSRWCQLANEKLMSVSQWAADISWLIRTWHQLANNQLTSLDQWTSNVRCPKSYLCQLSNEQLMPVGQWAADVS